MKKTWWKEAICYQVYPRSFKDSNGDGIGDIKGVIQKLDYLNDLGIDVIWLSPIYESPNDDNGYDISDYKKILDDFGTMSDFDELLEQAHSRNMKIIMDLVVNHTSDEHEWFIESKKGSDNPYHDWYIWEKPKSDGSEPNNWASIFEGSAWEYEESIDKYYMHLFSKKQPDLNWENKDMREAIYEMINWWLDKGIDGFRVDAISHIKKSFDKGDLKPKLDEKYVSSFSAHMNQEGIHKHLNELKEKTLSNYDIMTVGEANGVTIDDASDWVGEKDGKFNMVFQFEHLNLWDYNSNEDFDVLGYKKVLNKWQTGLNGIGWNALFIENHDKPRIPSTWGSEDFWYESSTSHGMIYFFQKGTPFIYQGQEIGMTNYPFTKIEEFNDVHARNIYDKDLASGINENIIINKLKQQSRDNSRTPMQWNNKENAGFSDNRPWLNVNPNYEKINVENQLNDENSILNFYKKMIELKKSNDTLIYGDFELLLKEDEAVFAYTRSLNEEKYLVIANLTDSKKEISLIKQEYKLILGNYSNHKTNSINELNEYECRLYKIV